MTTTEFATGAQRGRSAHQTLAERSGVPLHRVVELATENRLNELFNHRGALDGGVHAKLAYLEECRNAPARKLGEPHVALAKLRALRQIWEIEEREIMRPPRDPWECLRELYARQIPPWWGLG
jgi:hypothetical protein